jgi:hypothetical protein
MEARLSDVSAFLRTAAKHGQAELLDRLWGAFASEPAQLEKRLLTEELHGISAFLRTAFDQSQLGIVEKSWSFLAGASDSVVNRASRTTLDSFGGFLTTARQQDQNVVAASVWRSFAGNVKQFVKQASAQRPSQLLSFLVLVPSDLKHEMLQQFHVSDWCYSQYRSQRFSTGAVARGKVGREDLSQALVANILHRKNSEDFADKKTALLEMSRLVSLATPDQNGELQDLLEAVCTSKWLTGGFRFGSTMALAGALHRIAAHLDQRAARIFQHPELTIRLAREWRTLENAEEGKLSGAVQLLGACQLVGCVPNLEILVTAPLGQMERLVDAMYQRAGDATKSWIRQLWHGLRVLASIGPGPMRVDCSVVQHTTLDLWSPPRTLAESGHKEETGARKNDTTKHHLDGILTAWLRACVQSLAGLNVHHSARFHHAVHVAAKRSFPPVFVGNEYPLPSGALDIRRFC